MKDSRSEISNEVKYDAFISYRHCELDSLIAEKLHKKLEHYHIPRVIQQVTGRKKISRIFRDKEELPLSANLTDNIYQALDHSEFLILICSPESMQSVWVQREVEYFVKMHGKEHVLTVLVKGEPEESFPRLLCEDIQNVEDGDGNKTSVIVPVEPLAADVRGRHKKESLKKLDLEILRLLAAMLGCSYDSLKQRHKEYAIKRITVILCVALILTLGFSGFILYKNTEIEKQYQLVRSNQAKYLAEYANTLMDRGDRIGALEAIMEIRPEQRKAEAPVVPEQWYALNRALYSYHRSDNYFYYPEKQIHLGAVTMKCSGVSEDGKYWFSLDDKGMLCVYDTETFEMIWEVKSSEINRGGKSFKRGEFLADGRLVASSGDGVFILDFLNKTCEKIWKPDLEETEDIVIATSDAWIACTEEFNANIFLYPIKASESVTPKDIFLKNTEDCYWYIKAMKFSEDGKKLVVSAEKNDWLADYKKGYTFYMETESGKILWEKETGVVKSIEFTQKGNIGVVAYNDEELDFNDMVLRNLRSEKYFAAVISAEDGRILWKSDEMKLMRQYVEEGFGVYDVLEFSIEDKNKEIIVFYMSNTITVLDAETYELLHQNAFDDTIVGINQLDETNLLIGLANGKIYRSMLHNFAKIFETEQEVFAVDYIPKKDAVIQIQAGKQSESSYNLVVLKQLVDERMVPVGSELPFKMPPSDVDLEDDEELVVYVENQSYSATYTDGRVIVTKGEKEICRIEIDDTDFSPLLSFIGKENHLIIYNGMNKILLWDVENNKELFCLEVILNSSVKDELLVAPDGRYFALGQSEGKVTLTEEGLVFRELDMFLISDNHEIYRYANIPYGEVNFETGKIYSWRAKENRYYEAPFYQYWELEDMAKEILEGNER